MLAVIDINWMELIIMPAFQQSEMPLLRTWDGLFVAAHDRLRINDIKFTDTLGAIPKSMMIITKTSKHFFNVGIF